MFNVEKKSFSNAFVPVNIGEVMRYAGIRNPAYTSTEGDASDTVKALIDDCIAEGERQKAINFEVCFAVTPLSIKQNVCDFNAFSLESKGLADALSGSKSALIFACTIGVDIDRLIRKYSAVSPSRALMFQALGAERVETYIDLFLEDFCKDKKVSLSPRFSAGYGDLPLAAQRDIFKLLSPEKLLGLTLNDSLLMSPSKSVTAFAGIKENGGLPLNNGGCKISSCERCQNKTCAYRK